MEKTYSLKKSEVTSKWWVIDAQNCVSGRLASAVVHMLHNKHKVDYTPNMRSYGDYIIIVNINKLVYTGNKKNQKLYRRHTGYFGGLKETLLKDMDPVRAFRHAIAGMISKGPSKKFMLRRLKLFSNSEHNHQAQNPELVSVCNQYWGTK